MQGPAVKCDIYSRCNEAASAVEPGSRWRDETGSGSGHRCREGLKCWMLLLKYGA